MQITNISSSADIKQRWTADTREELDQRFAECKKAYPTTGYGTTLYDVKQNSDGTWSGIYYRFHCCD